MLRFIFRQLLKFNRGGGSIGSTEWVDGDAWVDGENWED